MIRDPIVEEVRRAGEELEKAANYDVHTFFENLYKAQKKYAGRVVQSIRKPLQSTAIATDTEMK